jgi:hypothetical protein
VTAWGKIASGRRGVIDHDKTGGPEPSLLRLLLMSAAGMAIDVEGCANSCQLINQGGNYTPEHDAGIEILEISHGS